MINLFINKKSTNNFKKHLFLLEKKHSFFGRFLIVFLRELRFLFYKILFLFDKNKIREKDVFKIYWVNPQKIKYCYDGPFDVFKNRGSIKSGDWDIGTKKFKDIETYQGMRERFVEEKEWQQTKFYSDFLEKINKGKIAWHCMNEKQWKSRLKSIDVLYNDIKINGYRVQTGKNKISDTYEGRADKRYQKIDEVLVSIGRDGQLLFNDGAHRLAIAKILELPEIPVMVLARHVKWVNFKKELTSYGGLQNGKLYQCAYHFDLEDIPYVYGQERFDLIKASTSFSGGVMLDIGANIGYFCHKFEGAGFDCFAVDVNPQNIYFMKKLRNANNDNFEVIKSSIFDYKKNKKLSFDIVLALNIFHHFLKREDVYNKLKILLGRIEAKEMFFESHNPKEFLMKNSYKNYASKDFVEFIIKNSSFENYFLLTSFKDGRKLYKIF